MNCQHSEGRLVCFGEYGNPLERLVPGHDCEYVDARNALIPAAERLARQRMAAGQGHWTPLFMAAMDELWAKRNSGGGGPAVTAQQERAFQQIAEKVNPNTESKDIYRTIGERKRAEKLNPNS